MDAEMLAEAREEMIAHDSWVARTTPILINSLGAAKVEAVVRGLELDRIDNEIQFTQGMIADSQKANSEREGPWGYPTVVVRMCAALYRLAEAQMEIDRLRNALPFEGNRRTGQLPE